MSDETKYTIKVIKVKSCRACPYNNSEYVFLLPSLIKCNHLGYELYLIDDDELDTFPEWCPLEEDVTEIAEALTGENVINIPSSTATEYLIEKDDGGELINILMTPENAAMFFEILCELPFRAANSYDNEPPTEREEPVESVLAQLYTQLQYDEEIIDDDE